MILGRFDQYQVFSSFFGPALDLCIRLCARCLTRQGKALVNPYATQCCTRLGTVQVFSVSQFQLGTVFATRAGGVYS